MKNSEFHLHCAIAAFLDFNAAPELWTWFHCPNGEKRTKAAANRLKAMGVEAGVPDIVIYHNGRIIYVEVKGPYGSLSPAQKAWRAAAIARGAAFHVVKSLEEMAEVLTGLGIRLRARLAT